MARFSTTAPFERERIALGWLNVPRTAPQIAALVGVTPNHASALLRRLWLQGKAERSGCCRLYRYTRAEAAHGEV